MHRVKRQLKKRAVYLEQYHVIFKWMRHFQPVFSVYKVLYHLLIIQRDSFWEG